MIPISIDLDIFEHGTKNDVGQLDIQIDQHGAVKHVYAGGNKIMDPEGLVAEFVTKLVGQRYLHDKAQIEMRRRAERGIARDASAENKNAAELDLERKASGS